jgi:hypothetical protein
MNIGTEDRLGRGEDVKEEKGERGGEEDRRREDRREENRREEYSIRYNSNI